MLGAFHEGKRTFHGRPNHVAQVEALALQNDPARYDPGDFQQVVDQLDHQFQLTIHHVPQMPKPLGCRIDDGQQVDAGFDRRERIAQLVRQCGEEFVLATIGLAQRLLGESQFLELISDLDTASGDPAARP